MESEPLLATSTAEMIQHRAAVRYAGMVYSRAQWCEFVDNDTFSFIADSIAFVGCVITTWSRESAVAALHRHRTPTTKTVYTQVFYDTHPISWTWSSLSLSFSSCSPNFICLKQFFSGGQLLLIGLHERVVKKFLPAYTLHADCCDSFTCTTKGLRSCTIMVTFMQCQFCMHICGGKSRLSCQAV